MADAPGEAPRQPLGGAFHTYLGFDAVRFGTAMPSDAGGAARGAFEHMLATGSMRRFTDEELANAVRIDPSQIQGLGPSIESLIELLEARKAKILATFDPAPAAAQAAEAFGKSAERALPDDGSELHADSPTRSSRGSCATSSACGTGCPRARGRSVRSPPRSSDCGSDSRSTE